MVPRRATTKSLEAEDLGALARVRATIVTFSTRSLRIAPAEQGARTGIKYGPPWRLKGDFSTRTMASLMDLKRQQSGMESVEDLQVSLRMLNPTFNPRGSDAVVGPEYERDL